MILPPRFWTKVDKNGPDGFHSQTGANLGPCWLWLGSIDPKGYGRFGFGKPLRPMRVHRLTFIEKFGSIEEGLVPDHLCRVHACCNPDHVEAVTLSVNVRRGRGPALAAARLRLVRPSGPALLTQCARGHVFDEKNTYVKNGKRRCRACNRLHQAKARTKAIRG